MADERQKFLRGRIDRTDTFQAVYGGTSEPPPLPSPDPAKHREKLTRQLDRIAELVAQREDDVRVESATRELVAVRPEQNTELIAESLSDSRSDTRFVSLDEDTGVVVLDAADTKLKHLRGKINAFADDSRVSDKGTRRSARAVAPISTIDLAQFDDLAGSRVCGVSLKRDEMRWFEIACRGGYRNPEGESIGSRKQMRQALERLGVERPQEYMATERLVFFLRCSLEAIERLIGMVDCIYEFDLAGPDVRDFLTFEVQLAEEVAEVQVTPPARAAPSIALLDSGLEDSHPLLKGVFAGSVSIVPGFEDAPGDTDGHGTQMAGVAAYWDVGEVVDAGNVKASHWLESARVFVAEGAGTAREEHRQYWPQMTTDAVEKVEALKVRDRVFATAVAAPVDHPGRATFWSHAVDRLAYNDGDGRVFFACVGNARSNELHLLESYPSMNLEEKIWDPAQAVNAITVGAFTQRTELPPDPSYARYDVIAPSGGISPHTSAGLIRDGDAIKPDIVFEGGNIGFDGQLPNATIPTLVALTTHHRHSVGEPLSLLNATSEATARAAWFGATLLRLHPELWAQTIRGLIVHSASWTGSMRRQFPNLDERLAICGFGVPDLEFASTCAQQRATVLVQSEMPNAIGEPMHKEDGRHTTKFSRVLKAFRMPFPEELLLTAGDERVELRVTLSYFAEPNTFRRRLQRGLDLRWDMQGIEETEQQFLERINKLARGQKKRKEKTKGLQWDLGIRRRSRGTVQSDRWSGPASLLAGKKLIAVYPVLGWWDGRKELRTATMPFSLIVTVRGTTLPLYESIASELETEVTIDVEHA